MEKKRLKENYNKHLAEINSHLKNLIEVLNNKSKNI
jgi:ferritin-like metal-binding protein YciE